MNRTFLEELLLKMLYQMTQLRENQPSAIRADDWAIV